MNTDVSARSGASATISRRRIVQGAAWAAPAVIIATAAPAFASSNPGSGTTTPTAVFQATTYKPNKGESYQKITTQLVRSSNGSTAPIELMMVTATFVKDSGGAQASSAVSQTTGWVLYENAADPTRTSVFPVTNGATGRAAFIPSGTVTMTTNGETFDFSFNLNRFASITTITLVYKVGGVEHTASVTPTAA